MAVLEMPLAFVRQQLRAPSVEVHGLSLGLVFEYGFRYS